MNQILNITLLGIVGIALCGCGKEEPPTEHTYKDEGKVIGIEVRGNNDWNLGATRIETTRGIFYIDRVISVEKGANASLRDDGYLSIDGLPYMYKIDGY